LNSVRAQVHGKWSLRGKKVERDATLYSVILSVTKSLSAAFGSIAVIPSPPIFLADVVSVFGFGMSSI
jgi:hypothetical protein